MSANIDIARARGLSATLFVATAMIAASAAHAAQSGGNATTTENPSYSDAPMVEVRDAELRYVGKLNAIGVARLRESLLTHPQIDTLRIGSSGGNGLDGIEIAKLVHERRLQVIVEDRCNSACANHIFAPAVRKTILPGAMVMWHNACPQNIDAGYKGTDTIDGKVGNVGLEVLIDGKKATDEQIKRMSGRQRRQLNEKARDYFARYAVANDAFFSTQSGIDPRVTCLGDYLDLPGSDAYAYTLSVADMERFGVCDVQAPDDYPQQVIARLQIEGKTGRAGVIRLSDHPDFSPRFPAGGCSARPSGDR